MADARTCEVGDALHAIGYSTHGFVTAGSLVNIEIKT
jgi:hypothetical protein